MHGHGEMRDQQGGTRITKHHHERSRFYIQRMNQDAHSHPHTKQVICTVKHMQHKHNLRDERSVLFYSYMRERVEAEC